MCDRYKSLQVHLSLKAETKDCFYWHKVDSDVNDYL